MWKVWICPQLRLCICTGSIHFMQYGRMPAFKYFTKKCNLCLFSNISSVILKSYIIGSLCAFAACAPGIEKATEIMEFGFEHNALPNSLELAYLGDAIYDFYVRERLVRRGGKVQKLHKAAISMVCAHAQAEALGRIEGVLTEAEADVVRRARNVHQNPPRNANPAEYHRATGLEALIGYLYLTRQQERMDELIRMAMPEV